MNSAKTAVVALYTHIEGYPPSLNAVQLLSGKFSRITIVHRNTMDTTWPFKSNVELVSTKKFVHFNEVARKSFFWKIRSFVLFTILIRQVVAKRRPDWLIIYEPNALLSWFIIAKTLRWRPKIWYHSHDVIQGNEGFLSYWAYFAQGKLFPFLDKFSLPTESRLSYFPTEKLKQPPSIIPNFPSLSFFGRWNTSPDMGSTIKLIFQGHISADNGLDFFVKTLPLKIYEKKIELHLVGLIDEEYSSKLKKMARDANVSDQLIIYGRLNYSQLPPLTASCNIGLGTYGNQNIMVRTMGTASNKIYEYASVGLPIIVFDNEQFRAQLGRYSWVTFTDGSVQSIQQCIYKIVDNYKTYSRDAKCDFENELNFERKFVEVIEEI